MRFEELHAKLVDAFKQYSAMLIQEEIAGDEVRVLVIFGKVRLAINRIPPTVVGNGKNTLQTLIEQENMHPLRGEGYEKPLAHIRVDQELEDYVEKFGYTLQSIIPQDTVVTLRGNSNLGTGGTLQDVTEILSPETIKLCESVASRLNMALCGIDILTPDIRKPLKEAG